MPARYTDDQLRAHVKKLIAKRSTKFQYEWAREQGVSPDGLTTWLSGKGGAPPTLLVALGLQKTTFYETPDYPEHEKSLLQRMRSYIVSYITNYSKNNSKSQIEFMADIDETFGTHGDEGGSFRHEDIDRNYDNWVSNSWGVSQERPPW